MKVLMINGSPHKNGSTYTALTIVGEELKKYGVDYEIMWIGAKPVSGCLACSTCKQTGKCVFDDIVNEFMEKGKDCDGFVFGSPVYYASATGQITSFLDRLFMAYRQLSYGL
ncbi:MAG TPA: flavodoxin family protein [Clostridia bacterium]|nr:flavodoxin family protein [Clostridia bacterium]